MRRDAHNAATKNAAAHHSVRSRAHSPLDLILVVIRRFRIGLPHFVIIICAAAVPIAEISLTQRRVYEERLAHSQSLANDMRRLASSSEVARDDADGLVERQGFAPGVDGFSDLLGATLSQTVRHGADGRIRRDHTGHIRRAFPVAHHEIGVLGGQKET